MIRDFFTSTGRMVRMGIIVGALLLAASLMILGAKISGWVGDASHLVRERQLDQREAALKKQEADALAAREKALADRERKADEDLGRLKAERDKVKVEIENSRKAAAAEAAAAKRARVQAEAAVHAVPASKPVDHWALDYNYMLGPQRTKYKFDSKESCVAHAREAVIKMPFSCIPVTS